MKKNIYLALLGLCMALMNTNSYSETYLYCLDTESLETPNHEFIVNSLKKLYHGGHRTAEGIDNILCMTGEQYDRAESRYEMLAEEELTLLNDRYQDYQLHLWALRDTNGDEVLDFRTKEYGAFIQNDTDADGDNIPNIMDPLPLSSDSERDAIKYNDEDGDGLPNHLDWSNANWHPAYAEKSPYLIDQQKKIFEKYGIVLIEADGSKMSDLFVDMTNDVLTAFQRLRRKYSQKETASSITLTDQYAYDEEGKDPYDVLAEVSPVNGQIIVYEYGLKNVADDPDNLIGPFMVYVHEFAHVIQNAMDFDNNRDGLLKYNVHTKPVVFTKIMKAFGWDFEEQDEDSLRGGVVDHGNEAILMQQKIAKNYLSDIVNQCEDAPTSDDEQYRRELIAYKKTYKVVSCYALNSAREWHAEYIAVSLLTLMYNHVQKYYPQHAAGIINLAQSKMKRDWGQPFDLISADLDALKALAKEMRLTRRLIRTLSLKYLVLPFEKSKQLALSSRQYSPFYIRDAK